MNTTVQGRRGRGQRRQMPIP